MKKKTFLMLLCLMLILSTAAMGTIAYMTDWAKVTNTFSVGNVDIRVDESAVNRDGTVIPGAERVTGNDYHLLPGSTYVKDPMVTMVAGSESAHVRMLVTINKVSELEAIFGSDFLPEKYVTGWDRETWPCVGMTEADNTRIYEFRYFEPVLTPADEDLSLAPLFTAINVPGEITGAQLKTIADLEITVVGQAIQTGSFNGADEAWLAFDAQESPAAP